MDRLKFLKRLYDYKPGLLTDYEKEHIRETCKKINLHILKQIREILKIQEYRTKTEEYFYQYAYSLFY
jgi:hypothetical protein